MRKIAILITLSLAGGSVLNLLAQQQAVLLVTGPLSAQDKAASLEAEVITVGRLSAYPAAITRHAGKFILILHSRGADPKSAFTLEAVAATESTAQAATPVVRFDLTRAPYGVLGGAINPPAGRYQLKSVSTGQVLCQLTIN
jgi:hypothetical protein